MDNATLAAHINILRNAYTGASITMNYSNTSKISLVKIKYSKTNFVTVKIENGTLYEQADTSNIHLEPSNTFRFKV